MQLDISAIGRVAGSKLENSSEICGEDEEGEIRRREYNSIQCALRIDLCHLKISFDSKRSLGCTWRGVKLAVWMNSSCAKQRPLWVSFLDVSSLSGFSP